MHRVVLAFCLAFTAFCAYPQSASKPTRVLFVGNASIAADELMGRVSKIAEATGRPASVEIVAPSRHTLADHAADAETLAAIRRGWDFVVLEQDVPPDEQRAAFVAAVKRLGDAVRASGAKPALFMAWPRADRRALFREAIAANREAAQGAGATLVPAAEAWLRALGTDPKLRLYTGDGMQPAPLGADLAALTLYFALFPAGPQEFDEAYVAKIARALDLPSGTRDLLIDAATRAIDEPLPLTGKRLP